MAKVLTLPWPLTAGTKARGSHVLANDQALLAGVDNIDDTQIISGANIQGSKLLTNSVSGDKIIDDTLKAVKLADDDTAGEGCNLSELATGTGFNDTGGYPPSVINANRKQHGGKTVWHYFNLDDTTRYLVDNSIDWRQRLIHVSVIGTTTGAPLSHLPGGGADNDIRGQLMNGTATPMVPDGRMNAVMFYSQAGSADGFTQPFGSVYIDSLAGGATPSTEIRFSADSATGGLMVKVQAFESTVTDLDFAIMVSCSPKIV